MAEPDSPKPKRRLKNAETIREQALKAQAEANRPSKPSKIGTVSRGALRPVKKSSRLFRFKPFRIIGLIIFPPYLRSSWTELRQVTWPSRRETRQLTVAVMIFAIIFGVLVAGVDYGLDKLFKEVLLK